MDDIEPIAFYCSPICFLLARKPRTIISRLLRG